MKRRRKRLLFPGIGVAGGGGVFYTTSDISIAPTAGPTELTTNGSFTAWTGDNPDNWGVIGEVGSDPMVNEVGTGETHGGAGTGACNQYSSATITSPKISQTVFTLDLWYRIAVTISANTGSKALRVQDALGILTKDITATSNFTGRAGHGDLRIYNAGVPFDTTLDDVSVKLLSTLTQLFTHQQPYGDFSVALTIPTTNYQGGVVFNYTDSNNYTLCYLNRVNGKVYLLKVVAGVVADIGNWAASYSAGGVLTARRYKDGTMDVIYNGTTLVSGAASTGLTGLQAGPWLTDATGVTIGSYTWDARTTT